jgi:hypothetical protein
LDVVVLGVRDDGIVEVFLGYLDVIGPFGDDEVLENRVDDGGFTYTVVAIDDVEFVGVGYRGEIIGSVEHEVREGGIDGGHRVYRHAGWKHLYPGG